MDSIFVQIALRGDRRIRELKSQEIQTQAPQAKRWLMARKDGVSQIVETSLTGLAQGALTRGLPSVDPGVVLSGLSQWGHCTPSGPRQLRTVSQHLASSMRDCMCIMAPVSPIASSETSARDRVGAPHKRKFYQLPGIHIEPLLLPDNIVYDIIPQ